MIALQTKQQLGLHLERLCHKSLVKEVEKLANKCYYMSLKMLLKQNDKMSADLTHLNEMVVWLGTMSHPEDYTAK